MLDFPLALRPAGGRCDAPALAAGTIVLTLEGALPVEYLGTGDRIITRAGARVLRHIESDGRPGAPGFRLGFDAPEVIYADGQEVAVRPLA